MKQIETVSETQSNPGSELHAATPPPTAAPARSPHQANWVQRGLALAIAAATSATLGLTAALLLPLPIGLIAKDKSVVSNVWRVGLGYQVGRPVNILIMGIDRVPGAEPGTEAIFSGRSDTMLLLRVNPEQDTVSLLSIPRDTQVQIPEIGLDKINDANVQGGPALAAKTVSSTLNGVAIDRYVRVSTDAFKELVDLLGGIEVYVPKPMQYEDKTQKLKIDLQPGNQTLSGAQAEQFARFRNDDLGDIGRVQRQQALLKALRSKLMNPTVIPRIPALVKAMQKYIDTNLSLEELLALVGAGRKLSDGNFKMVMLPGRFSAPGEYVASYWIMDPAGRDRVMQQYFDVTPQQADTAARSATDVRIAIQNASGSPNGARELQQDLAKLGYINVYVVADWPDAQTETRIIAQGGDLAAADAVRQALGLGQVQAESTGDLESDFTIRIGQDWLQQHAQK